MEKALGPKELKCPEGILQTPVFLVALFGNLAQNLLLHSSTH